VCVCERERERERETLLKAAITSIDDSTRLFRGRKPRVGRPSLLRALPTPLRASPPRPLARSRAVVTRVALVSTCHVCRGTPRRAVSRRVASRRVAPCHVASRHVAARARGVPASCQQRNIPEMRVLSPSTSPHVPPLHLLLRKLP